MGSKGKTSQDRNVWNPAQKWPGSLLGFLFQERKNFKDRKIFSASVGENKSNNY